MKKLFYILFIGLTTTSCSNSNDCCIVLDINVLLKFVDQNNQNILDEINGINSSEITIYYKINDEWVEYYDRNLDNPKGYSIMERNNEKYLELLPSIHYDDDDFSETKIQFSKNEFDIIRAKINSSNGNIICTKVWYNERLEWESSETERLIEIIK